LRHRELLDAAHIIPDTDVRGVPLVTNGIALCKLHHAAFDSYIIGISPSRIVEVRKDILDEEDGPMLLHGLQGIHGRSISVPRHPADHPSPKSLEVRYEEFRKAG
jgi:putative restriction endonuclease